MAKMIRPLRRLGVNLTDVGLKQFAFEQGMINSPKAALEGAQRYWALVKFIKKEMPMAYGFDPKAGKEITDAERTVGSLWNRIKGLKGFLKDLGVEWGAQANTGLQLADTIGIINNALKSFQTRIAENKSVEKYFSKFRDIMENLAELFKSFGEDSDISKSWSKFAASVKDAFAPVYFLFDEILNSPAYKKFRDDLLTIGYKLGENIASGFWYGMGQLGDIVKAAIQRGSNKLADTVLFGTEKMPGVLSNKRERADLGRTFGLIPQAYQPNLAKAAWQAREGTGYKRYNALSGDVNTWGSNDLLQQIADNTAKIPELKAE
jgi:hypothetical protein